ncbi:DEAD/DEAH box helicase [Wohlfahrtiimonas chitiniclastica]|uniref:DEAD/DEAH box helicase n=1 Tax=Wohlfahrtiimonas chitiniclastica TaxID=400946 RepID=UPI001BCB5DB0|nr:DEAD/DEAH box helicase [Wohlfahrtiimonas chitiniclastica]MBS7821500.1 DEAD/DEAH box helicase [Wohlfahrtiimonas chitiniclastica]
MLDFNALNMGVNQKQIEPRKIFTTLMRSPRFKRPLDEQSDVLDEWYDKRQNKDLTIKMNTGGGKTVVGLLCLQSSLNENIKPAVYLTPDKYLTHQVIEEARELGIAVTDNEKDPNFISGDAILVTNIYKLFNGRSVFGIEEIKIPVGAVVIDDAHACLDTITSQFTIKIHNAEIHKELLDLFDEDLKKQSASRLLDLREGDVSITAAIPYWAWQSKSDDVMRILHGYRNNEEIQFQWPLIKDSLLRCQCIFSGKEVEITPYFLPINKIPSFDNAKRRIYMTATLADDTILVSHLQANPDSIKNPIIPKNGGDIGDRMILLPQEINPEFTITVLKKLLIELSLDKNVVVIVPSKYYSDFWKDSASLILDKDTLKDGVEKLKQGHVGLVVLINKYDGIDLPGKACEVLVICDLPEVYSLKERYEMQLLDGTKRQLIPQIQRIEQGIGRGVRSNDDYCVVFLIGNRLTQRLHQPEANSIFSKATQAQISLGKDVTKQIRGKSIEDLKQTLNYCLDRHESWIATSRNAVVNAAPVKIDLLDNSQVSLRRAFDFSEINQNSKAIEEIQTIINTNTFERKLLGYMKQQLATYTNFINPVDAQELQLSALSLNYNAFKTLDGIQYTKLTSPVMEQAVMAQEFMKRFITGNELIVWVNAVLSDLIWGNQSTQTKRFEKAIYELGLFLGFGSQCPEDFIGKGPDNLWALGGLSYLVIECKSGAVTCEEISKHDTNQLGGSINWFVEKYDGSCSMTPIMIHPKKTFNHAASPNQTIRLIGVDELDLLKNNVHEYSKALIEKNNFTDKGKIAQLLAHYNFQAQQFVQKYTVGKK